MKTFYTERDIVDMHAAGVTEIKVDDTVVLTDLAREKAEALGVTLTPAGQRRTSSGLSSSMSPPTQPELDTVAQVKARVIARLGTGEYNDVLDQVIPQVLARLSGGPAQPAPNAPSKTAGSDH